MQASNRAIRAFAVALAVGLCVAFLVPFATRSSRASSATVQYYINPVGSDTNDGRTTSTPFRTIQKAIDLAQPGDVVTLAPGNYLQDVVSRRSGTPSAPITLTGPADAVVKGGGNARIIEINHDNITLDGFTINGLWAEPTSASGYRDKLLYVLGKAPLDGVNGLRVLNMTFKNAGGECVRLRYFAQHNEVARSTFLTCGVNDFRFKAGGKNGEGIYIGTAPEQLGDGKNPTTDPDQSSANWIHHNSFNTQGNECVDIKEASAGNIVEFNTCTGQQDPNSGGFDARGNGNIFRNNESYGNLGAAVRLGGDTATSGIGNEVYLNSFHDNRAGGIAFQGMPQGKVCGNVMSNNSGGNAVGAYGARFNPVAACDTAPAPTSTSVPAPTGTSVPAPTGTSVPAPTSTPSPPNQTGCNRPYAVDGATTTLIEAEQYTSMSGRFTAVADAARSGGTFMQIPGSGMRKDPNSYLSFDLDVSNGGSFSVWLLGSGRNSSSDSFFVQADNGALITGVLVQKKWGWKKIGGTITLANGRHILSIKDREDGASIDTILLTKDSRFAPAGLSAAGLTAQCR
jgi:Protein of unknown function (DUF1565)